MIQGRTTPCETSGACLESLTIFSRRDIVSLYRGWVVSKGGNARKIKLSEEEEVVVGGFLVTFDGLLVTVTLPQQVSLTWDGVSAAYIQLPDKNTHTCGLCGSVRSGQSDVLNMRNRHQWNRESNNLVSFAKSWRLDSQGRCQDPGPVPDVALLKQVTRVESDNQCEDIFNSSVLQQCRREFPADVYLEECQIETKLKSHVLNNSVSVPCYLGLKYIEMCSRVIGIQVPPTLHQLGCPSTRFLQQFVVSIGCPHEEGLPFQN